MVISLEVKSFQEGVLWSTNQEERIFNEQPVLTKTSAHIMHMDDEIILQKQRSIWWKSKWQWITLISIPYKFVWRTSCADPIKISAQMKSKGQELPMWPCAFWTITKPLERFDVHKSKTIYAFNYLVPSTWKSTGRYYDKIRTLLG